MRAGRVYSIAGTGVLGNSGNGGLPAKAALTAGHLYALAGDGVAGFAGDTGAAEAAELAGPDTMAVDPAGNVLITDSGNNPIRVVAAQTGTFYGVPMTAGDIYTIAGTGTGGFSGDDGPARSAELNGHALRQVALGVAPGHRVGRPPRRCFQP